MRRLVWLFAEHREAVETLTTLRAELVARDRVIQDLAEQLARAQARIGSPTELLENYRKDILQEEPFPNGQIPDHFWLTPEAV